MKAALNEARFKTITSAAGKAYQLRRLRRDDGWAVVVDDQVVANVHRDQKVPGFPLVIYVGLGKQAGRFANFKGVADKLDKLNLAEGAGKLANKTVKLTMWSLRALVAEAASAGTWPTADRRRSSQAIEGIGVSVADAAVNALSEELNSAGVSLGSFTAFEETVRKETRLAVRRLFYRAPEAD